MWKWCVFFSYGLRFSMSSRVSKPDNRELVFVFELVVGVCLLLGPKMVRSPRLRISSSVRRERVGGE